MPTRSTPLPLLLVLALAAATMLSCGSSGGSQFDDVCGDFADSILDCLEYNTSDGRLITSEACVDDLEESKDIDGDDCVQAQIAVYECLDVDDPEGSDPPPEDQCFDLFDFLALQWSDLFFPNGSERPPLPYCDTEIRAAVAECPGTIVLPGDPNVPLS